MPCKDCYNNCGQNLTTDQCTKYTGADNETLDICNGDPLSKVNEAVIEKLVSALDGTGITPSEVTLENCEYIKERLGDKDPTLTNLLQVLIDAQCTWDQALSALQTSDEGFVFDPKCLAGTTRDDLIQAAINKICTLNTSVNNFSTTYLKTTDLETKVVQIVTQQGSTSTQYFNRAIPHVAYEYYGPLSNFDNTGKGISTLGFDKMFLCNGLNGTPDRRGRAGVGAIANVPGGPLDAAVDPNNVLNPQTNYALKDKFGANYHKLTVTEMPSHSHKVEDPGHSHDYEAFNWENRPGGNNVSRKDAATNKSTGTSLTGITLAGAGGDQAHNNRQPSIAAYYIMYIP